MAEHESPEHTPLPYRLAQPVHTRRKTRRRRGRRGNTYQDRVKLASDGRSEPFRSIIEARDRVAGVYINPLSFSHCTLFSGS